MQTRNVEPYLLHLSEVPGERSAITGKRFAEYGSISLFYRIHFLSNDEYKTSTSLKVMKKRLCSTSMKTLVRFKVCIPTLISASMSCKTERFETLQDLKKDGP